MAYVCNASVHCVSSYHYVRIIVKCEKFVKNRRKEIEVQFSAGKVNCNRSKSTMITSVHAKKSRTQLILQSSSDSCDSGRSTRPLSRGVL